MSACLTVSGLNKLEELTRKNLSDALALADLGKVICENVEVYPLANKISSGGASFFQSVSGACLMHPWVKPPGPSRLLAVGRGLWKYLLPDVDIAILELHGLGSLGQNP